MFDYKTVVVVDDLFGNRRSLLRYQGWAERTVPAKQQVSHLQVLTSAVISSGSIGFPQLQCQFYLEGQLSKSTTNTSEVHLSYNRIQNKRR